MKKKKIDECRKMVRCAIQKEIRNEMDDSFKKAFVPKGWAVIKISDFVNNLTKDVVDRYIVLKKH